MKTGKAAVTGELGVTPREATRTSGPTGVLATACLQRRSDATREAPAVEARDLQPDAREGQAGPPGVADRPVVPSKPGNAGGGKGPEFKTSVRKSTRAGRLAMSLAPPPKVQKLQTALHAKAKGSPSYRFYRLYDKVYRRDILEFAYLRCRSNDGAPGVDGQTFEDIEAYGRDRWLDELTTELRKRTYRPHPVRRVFIPKAGWQATSAGDRFDPGPRGADGGGAGLGADLRGRPAAGAIRLPARPQCPGRRQASPWAVNTGHTEVVDADLSGYFDSIPHAELMKSLSRRISDRHLLGLIKMWLVAPVEETDERGRTHRTTRNKDEGRGSPQGSPLSPLLANIYMRRFILGWKILGHEQRFDAHIVNYADDRLRDLLSGHRRRGDGRDAGHDVEAAVDGERDEDAAVPCSRGDVRLPGLHDRPVLLAADGPSLHRDAAVGEEDRGPSGRDPRVDRPSVVVDGGRGPSGATEPDACWVGRTTSVSAR